MSLHLDHVVMGARDLGDALEWFTEWTGVAPQAGGSHPDHGTHNAVVGLAPHAYLEILAPDPRAPNRTPYVEKLRSLTALSPVGWCFRSENLRERVARLRAAGLTVNHLPMTRTTPAGKQLRWELAIVEHDYGPAVPFLIDWGATPNPAAGAPGGCRLVGIVPTHPEPAGPQRLLDLMGVPAKVAVGPLSGLRVSLSTPHGPRELAA